MLYASQRSHQNPMLRLEYDNDHGVVFRFRLANLLSCEKLASYRKSFLTVFLPTMGYAKADTKITNGNQEL